MVEFKNTVLEDFKDVWVFCEQRQGKLMPTDFELISEGRKLADELGVKLCGLLLGDKVEGLAAELAGYGADEIIVCEHPLLKDYTTDAYTKVICDMVVERKPEALLVGATNIGRDLAPRCAACTPVCAPTAPIWMWIWAFIRLSCTRLPPSPMRRSLRPRALWCWASPTMFPAT